MTDETIALTADIVSAHVSHNNVAASDLPALIASVYRALADTTNPPAVEARKQEPAVPIRTSVKHDYIFSLESGKKMKMLKRYLMTNYQMTPDDYRKKWGLPRDYPMVAPAYAATRKALALTIGLGRKKAADAVETVEVGVKSGAKKLGIVVAKAATAVHLGNDAAPKKRGRPAKVV